MRKPKFLTAKDISLTKGLLADGKISQGVHELEGAEPMVIHHEMTDRGVSVRAALDLSHHSVMYRAALSCRRLAQVSLRPN